VRASARDGRREWTTRRDDDHLDPDSASRLFFLKCSLARTVGDARETVRWAARAVRKARGLVRASGRVRGRRGSVVTASEVRGRRGRRAEGDRGWAPEAETRRTRMKTDEGIERERAIGRVIGVRTSPGRA